MTRVLTLLAALIALLAAPTESMAKSGKAGGFAAKKGAGAHFGHKPGWAKHKFKAGGHWHAHKFLHGHNGHHGGNVLLWGAPYAAWPVASEYGTASAQGTSVEPVSSPPRERKCWTEQVTVPNVTRGGVAIINVRRC